MQDWVEAEFGDVIDVISGKNQKAVENPNGKYPIYGSGGIFGYANQYLCEAGTTVIGRKGTINSPIYVNQKFWNVDTAFGIYPLSNQIQSKYIYYFCVGFNFKKLDKSTTIPSLAKRDILKIITKIPPLPEQRAIVSKIEQLFSELDNAITNFKKAQAQLKVYRQAVLKKAFEGELTKEWRSHQTDLPTAEELLEQIKVEREAHYQKQLEEWEVAVKKWEADKRPKDVKEKKPTKPSLSKELPPLTKDELGKLPELPSGWSWVKLGEVNSVKGGKRLPPKHSFSMETTDYIYIMAGNLKGGTVKNKLTYIEKNTYEALWHYRVNGGDVYITIVGACIGDAGVIPKEFHLSILTENAAKIITPISLYNKYLSLWLNSIIAQTRIKGSVFSMTLGKLALNRVERLEIPITSVEEQNAIVVEIESRLSVCDKAEETLAENLVKAEALRQSILKKAFEGKLLTEGELEACRNEPDWEPAEKLLERIRAEKG
ncbi:MAG: restriction endonuclease subunit S [Leptospirales bacterium]